MDLEYYSYDRSLWSHHPGSQRSEAEDAAIAIAFNLWPTAAVGAHEIYNPIAEPIALRLFYHWRPGGIKSREGSFAATERPCENPLAQRRCLPFGSGSNIADRQAIPIARGVEAENPTRRSSQGCVRQILLMFGGEEEETAGMSAALKLLRHK